MPLLHDDEQYLKNKGFMYELHEETSRTLVVIKQFRLPPIYTQETVDLLVIVPQGYPVASLDMFWVIPEVRVASSNTYPVNADVFETYLGQRWQRFSRHYNWRPHIDSLGSHINAIQNTLSRVA